MFNELNFARPELLGLALAIPLVWIGWILFSQVNKPSHQLEKFIDAHLLPYLLVNKSEKISSSWKHLVLWSLVWGCLTLGIAGPRWNFREIETFSKDQSLVILLDLSNSMNAADIKPSRLARAKQKIEDILSSAKGVKIGLIAFAADPHMITPLTDDKETIRHLLPSLDTDLVYMQGSRLAPALDMAYNMLTAEPGNNKSILVISDGGFEDATAIKTSKALAEKGIAVHAMGVGTLEGAPLKDKEGNIVKKNGTPILSKLEKDRFKEISTIGNGKYLEPSYSGQEETIILKDLENRAEAQMALGKTNKLWEENFYMVLLPVLPILLWWFRRGFIFAVLLLMPLFSLKAEPADYFLNQEQLGKQAFEKGDYAAAEHSFQDPYRRGVALYKAGKYPEAEEMFKQSTRPEIASSAGYNLGNSLAHQQKLKEAIVAYEDVLEQWPDHTKAKENLEIVKKMLEEQEQQQQDQNQDQNQDQKDKDQNNGKNEQENQDKQEQDPSENKDGSENKKDSNKKEPSSQGKEDKPEDQQKEQPKQEEQQQTPQPQDAKEEKQQEAKAERSQEDQDADLWLSRIENDPKEFMKNKFYIESKKNGTTEGLDPW